MASMNVKTGDKVVVLAGKDKGKTGTVLNAYPKNNRVTVKGVNVEVKHRKPRSQQDKGGIVKIEGPVDASNVQVICPACGKATRIAHQLDSKGNHVRVCKKCGANIATAKVKKAPKAKAQKTEEVAKTEKPAEKKTVTKTTATKAATTKTAATKTVKKDTTKAVKAATTASTAKKSSPTKKTAGK